MNGLLGPSSGLLATAAIVLCWGAFREGPGSPAIKPKVMVSDPRILLIHSILATDLKCKLVFVRKETTRAVHWTA